MDKIVVVAGNREQFQYWIRHNIILVTSKEDLNRLRGIKIGEVYYEGTYHQWFDKKFDVLSD